MQHLCPTCRKRFEHAGFCPFDGVQLVPAGMSDLPTLISAPFPVQPEPGPEPGSEPAPQPAPARPRDPEGAGAFATAPREVAPPATSEITQMRARGEPFVPAAARVRAASDPQQLQARSAVDDPSHALELMRESRDPDYDRLVGQTLDGRYFVERKIGEGGMGVVFRARHTVIERPLAIKVLKRDAMRDAATIRRFVQEAKAASRIGHPNIVDVTDFGTTPDGMTYSVMEFVAGQTLGSAIRHGAPFPPARALRITAQIARALAAAHDKGIVHRDLKPENVFLLDRDSRPDFVKIVDFGIAKVNPPQGAPHEPRLTRAGSVFGTPEYMAPEQAAGRSDTDGRVDIYALGVLLYEMICGRVPHRGDSMVRTLAMQMLDLVIPPSRIRPDLAIAPDLEAVIMTALAKKREQRYQTMGELLAGLDAVLPPPVGQSVTGSPVYQLPALPPGADPDLVSVTPSPAPLPSAITPPPAPPRPPLEPAPSSPASHSGEPARPPGEAVRKRKDEPEFTSGERPLSFEHVFTGEHAVVPPRRWPLVVLFALILAGAAGAFVLIGKSRRAALRHAGPGSAEIPATREVRSSDALPSDAAPSDAAVDATDLIVLPADAGRPAPRPALRSPAAPVIETPNHRGTIVVQVLTRPEGANLYEGSTYRGPGGTQIEELLGKKLTITCRQPGYKPGTVEISFDGHTQAVLCVLERIKRCIAGLKNPFDDCEPAP